MAKKQTTTSNTSSTFSDAERDAMKERAKELQAEAKRSTRTAKARADGEKDIQAKIAEMPQADAAMAQRIHELITKNFSQLIPRTWYGMPAYAKNGKVLCFFQGAAKFESRYATFGFSDTARLDDGNMWPTAFALIKLTSNEEKKILALVQKAVAQE